MRLDFYFCLFSLIIFCPLISTMDKKLKIITFNCQSLHANSSIIRDLLLKCDILCLQETLLDENNYQILEALDGNFMFAYTAAHRKPGCFVGRPSGGLAVLWRTASNVKFLPLYFDNRIMGLKINYSNENSILLLNVYMPCDYGNIDSLIDYKCSLASLENIIETESFEEVIITGDFDADPTKGRF